MSHVEKKRKVCLTLFFVDASGSTGFGFGFGDNMEYWSAVQKLNNQLKFDEIYTWDTECLPCQPEKLSCELAGGGTDPTQILDMLKKVLKKNKSDNVSFKLYVTTDGQVDEDDIYRGFSRNYDVVRNAIVSVNIYYIGRESAMNFGLNMIFGDTSNLSYCINSIADPVLVSTINQLTKRFELTGNTRRSNIDGDSNDATSSSVEVDKDCFTIDELLDPQLKRTLITRLGSARHKDASDSSEEKPLLRLRRAIISAFNRAKERDAEDVKLRLKRAYAENDAKLYIDTLKSLLYDVDSLNNQLDRRKCELLSYFDKHNREIYQHIDRFVESKTQDIDPSGSNTVDKSVNDENDKAEGEICWTDINDDITFDKVNNLPCMPIKVNETSQFAIQLSVEELRHPLALLANEPKRKLFATSFIEPYVIGYDTIAKIGISRNSSIGNNRDIFTSPYSRAFCYPFIVSPRTIAHLKYNTAAVSRLFDRKNDCALPGSGINTIVLWNFVVLWCAYERLNDNCQNNDDDEVRDKARVVWQELQSFCDNFNCMRFLSVKTSMPNEMVSLRESLWFTCWAVPQYAPNSTAFNQILRRPFGYAIFDAYVKLCNVVDEIELKEIRKLVDTWRVWSFMIDFRFNKDYGRDFNARIRRLEYLVRAQWQRWLEHDENELILLSGACAQPYPCIVNMSSLKRNVVWKMFELCQKRNSSLSRFHDLSSITRNSKRKGKDRKGKRKEKDLNDCRSRIYQGEKDQDYDHMLDIVQNHMSINPLTGHPYVLCPKTGLHWRECIGVGQYDAQRCSWYRLFYRFCVQYKRYPNNHLDLVAYLSCRYYKQQRRLEKKDEKNDYVIDEKILPIFEQIFKTFNDSIIACMTVDKYIELYKSFCNKDGEQKRLELEQKSVT